MEASHKFEQKLEVPSNSIEQELKGEGEIDFMRAKNSRLKAELVHGVGLSRWPPCGLER